jgi:peptidyl-prolyl cis-trans isomerase C
MLKIKKGIFLFSVFCFLFSGVLGCDKLLPKKPKPSVSDRYPVVEVRGTVIAKVNNQPITLEELDEEIESYNKLVPADRPEEKIDTRDKKIDYLKNEMVRRTIFAQAAMDRGLDRKEEIQKALNTFKQNLLVGELVREETANIEVSSQEIENYYNSYKEQLKEPEERRIREIVVATESNARDILIELLKGADFATLAQMRSTSASAKAGGDLGYLKKGAKFPQFDDVAFSPTLDVGRTSNYFRGPEGFYILKVEARKGGGVPNLSAVWDDIKNGLTFLKQQKKVEDLISRLSQNAKIEVIESAIK